MSFVLINWLGISEIIKISFTAVVSYLIFFFLIELSFSDTTVIEGGSERKRSWDLSLLIWETRYSN